MKSPSDYPYLRSWNGAQAEEETPLQSAITLFQRLYPNTYVAEEDKLAVSELNSMTIYYLKEINEYDRNIIRTTFKQYFSGESEVVTSIASIAEKIQQIKDKFSASATIYCDHEVYDKYYSGTTCPIAEIDYFLCRGNCRTDDFFWSSVNGDGKNSYESLLYNIRVFLNQYDSSTWEEDQTEVKRKCKEFAWEVEHRYKAIWLHVSDFTDIKIDIHNLLISWLWELMVLDTPAP